MTTTTTARRIVEESTRQQFHPVTGWYMLTADPHTVIVSLIDSNDLGMVETIPTRQLVEFVGTYPFTIERTNC